MSIIREDKGNGSGGREDCRKVESLATEVGQIEISMGKRRWICEGGTEIVKGDNNKQLASALLVEHIMMFIEDAFPRSGTTLYFDADDEGLLDACQYRVDAASVVGEFVANILAAFEGVASNLVARIFDKDLGDIPGPSSYVLPGCEEIVTAILNQRKCVIDKEPNKEEGS